MIFVRLCTVCFVIEVNLVTWWQRWSMATGNNYTLPAPPPLEIHDHQAAEKWKRFKRAWSNYSLATELDGKPEKVQVAMLLTVIGEDAREVFATFTWETEGDDAKIDKVIA